MLKQPVPDGYVRARHCLFLGTDEATKEAATAVFERVRQGSLSLDEATRQYSYCPTRDQLPAGDLGTFASLSCMRDVDELRSFDGRLALPYEGRNTRARHPTTIGRAARRAWWRTCAPCPAGSAAGCAPCRA